MTYSPPPNTDPSSLPEARVQRRYFAAIWLVPIIAALVATYLGVRSYAERGPEITITFQSGEGLTAGQTPVKYKSVIIGTVQNISLTADRSAVVAHVRMSAAAEPMLTDDARFWVVRPRLNTPSLTSLETLVSGTYIQLFPGEADSEKQTHFSGLEAPPDVNTDGAGTTYVLKAERLGSIAAGTPIFYRDMNVGEVLGVDMGDGFGPVSVNVLVHTPYDALVKPSSRFWNASGFTVKTGDGGLHVEMQSLQAVFSGGISFYTPPGSKDSSPAESKEAFKLYDNRTQAEAADTVKPIEYVTYIQSAVKDLAPGSPVQIFGIRVGAVTGVNLVFDTQKAQPRVRVTFDVQPDKAFGVTDTDDAQRVADQLVQSGMRVRMESSDLILGQEILSLEFAPDAGSAVAATENGARVLPAQAGGMDHLTDALGDIAGKLNQIPFDQIGDHLNHLAATADQMLTGPDMQQAIRSLEATLANAEEISKNANTNLKPALQKLPQISAQLQDAVAHANEFMAGLGSSYGQDSEFQRNAVRVLNEVNDAARSIRLLSDFLERHPEALLEGKAGSAKSGERNKP